MSVSVKSGFSFVKLIAGFYRGIVDMLWFIKNISKTRAAVESLNTKAPFCPKHEARMEFEKEEVWAGKIHEFKRHYKCPLCDYRTYTLYQAKHV